MLPFRIPYRSLTITAADIFCWWSLLKMICTFAKWTAVDSSRSTLGSSEVTVDLLDNPDVVVPIVCSSTDGAEVSGCLMDSASALFFRIFVRGVLQEFLSSIILSWTDVGASSLNFICLDLSFMVDDDLLLSWWSSASLGELESSSGFGSADPSSCLVFWPTGYGSTFTTTTSDVGPWLIKKYEEESKHVKNWSNNTSF